MNPRTFIQSLGVRSGESARFSCPYCGGNNTLSVSNDRGTIKYLCFKASCSTRGYVETERSSSDIRDSLSRSTPHGETEEDDFIEPDHWLSWNSDQRCHDWLRRNNCVPAILRMDVRCRFDPRRNRVAFVVRHRGRTVDAVGRALVAGTKPKWLRYASSPYPLIVGSDRSVGVIVEDAASACAVSGTATGIALLGTNLQTAAHAVLKPFDRLIIALDKDASKKAVALQAKLSYYKPTSVLLLEDDLKYLNPEQVRSKLENVL